MALMVVPSDGVRLVQLGGGFAAHARLGVINIPLGCRASRRYSSVHFPLPFSRYIRTHIYIFSPVLLALIVPIPILRDLGSSIHFFLCDFLSKSC